MAAASESVQMIWQRAKFSGGRVHFRIPLDRRQSKIPGLCEVLVLTMVFGPSLACLRSALVQVRAATDELTILSCHVLLCVYPV